MKTTCLFFLSFALLKSINAQFGGGFYGGGFSVVDTVVHPTYQQTAFNVTNLVKIIQFGVKVKYNLQDK